jgi:putative ABC transport system permease protein
MKSTLRTLLRGPLFTSVAVLVLALGIGVNTAVFSIVSAVFFRPLPVKAPRELVYVYQVLPKYQQVFISAASDVKFFQHSDAVFSGLTAHWGAELVVSVDGEAQREYGELVTGTYFDVLGVRPRLGRLLRPADSEPSMTEFPVVISDDLWARRFDRDPGVIGRTIRIKDKFFSIVGVAAAGFTGLTEPWQPARYWVLASQALDVDCPERDGCIAMGVIGRLKPGVSLSQAQAVVMVQADQMQRERAARYNWKVPPDWKPDRYVVYKASDVRTPFDPTAKVVPVRLVSAVAIVVAIVLVIASTNIAGLLVARGVTRSSELAVRQALGAGASHFVRQLLGESLLLSAAGGVAGLGVASLLIGVYRAYTPIRFLVDVSLDARVLVFTVGVCLAVGLLVGLGPVFQAFRVDILSALGGTGIGSARRIRRRLQHWVVVPQVALSIALLMVAGVHVRTLMKLEQADLGYRTENMLVLTAGYWDRYCQRPTRGDAQALEKWQTQEAERSRAFYQHLLDRVREIPGTAGIAITSTLPVQAMPDPPSYVSRDAPLAGHVMASGAFISPGYFRTMGITFRRGRDFDDRDTLNSPHVAVISEELARRLWPGQEAIGKSLAKYDPDKPDDKKDWLEVVGVAGEVDPILHDVGDRPFVYTPLSQDWIVQSVSVVVRAPSDLRFSVQTVKAAVAASDKFGEVSRFRTMSQIVGEILYPRRAAAGILVSSSLVGLFLAGIGLYGMIAYAVAQRLREMGIRSTLGASPRDLAALVLRQGLNVAALGAIPGFVLSALALRATSHLVGSVPTADAVAFVAVPALVLAVVLLASYLPARRAARVDPIQVLRTT